jgi:hypothetical protein
VHANDFQVFAGQLIVKVEIARLLVIAVDFIFLTDEKAVIVVNAADITLQQGCEFLGGKVEFGHSLGAEQIDSFVVIAYNARYRITEKAVGVILP